MPLDHLRSTTFCIGDWTVERSTGEMSRGQQLVRLEERTLRLLLCLAENAGQVISIDELLRQVWPGVVVSPDSVYQAITSLRRQLGDDPKHPTYIANVPRRGYRLIAAVTLQPRPALAREPAEVEPGTLPRLDGDARPAHLLLLIIALLALVACLLAISLFDWYAAPPVTAAAVTPKAHPRSVAVLQFVDLTDEMSEEPFADGMAEELIGALSKVPALAVSPAGSAYHRGEKQAMADVARALKVAYVLDGSVRKSGRMLRVTARLTRASDGLVAWSDIYDRSSSDKLMIQQDIAGEVSKALAKSIH